jgi:hypothetical protein
LLSSQIKSVIPALQAGVWTEHRIPNAIKKTHDRSPSRDLLDEDCFIARDFLRNDCRCALPFIKPPGFFISALLCYSLTVK